MIQKQPVTSKSAAFYIVCCYMLFSFWQRHTNGAVTISPFPRAAVCRIGVKLEVMCSTNESVLDWGVVLAGTNNRIDSSVTSTTQVRDIRTSNSIVFIFSRTSERGTLPLVSTLEITSVGLPLNTSTMTCMDSAGANATTVVHIVGENDAYHPNPPEVNIEEEFGVDSVTVFLQWIEELSNSLVIYHVSVEPMVNVVNGNGRANLTLLYNTQYTVSVVADFCGQRNATTTLIKNYVNCGAPSTASMSTLVMGYTNIALEGDNINFSCSSGLVLTGPNSSTCMGNGEWEPDPREVACEGGNEPLTSSESKTVDIVVGVVVAAAVIIAIIIVIVVMIACRGQMKGYLHRWKQRDVEGVHGTGNINSLENRATTMRSELGPGLMYADIGPSSMKHKKSTVPITLELDDSRVEYAHLDHGLNNKPVSAQQFNEPVESIAIDLDTLLIQLRPQVGPKWYQFGEAAGVPKDALDKIAEQCPPEECIVEVLDYWLRNTTRPTWKGVARILKAINLQQLAFDIERVYSTGKLPIEVNTSEVPHGFISKSLQPPPLPPKSMEPSDDDAPPVPPKMIEMITEDRVHRAPPLPPKMNESDFIPSQPMSGNISSRVPARPPKP